MFFRIRKSTVLLLFISLTAPEWGYSQTSESSNTVVSKQPSTIFSKENWGANYFNYMNGPTLSDPQGSSINHYLTLKRKIGKDWAVSGVFRPDSNFGNNKSSLTMGDPYLRVDYPSIFDGGDALKIKGDVRYFFPASEASQQNKVAGVVSPYINASGKTGALSYTYILIPKYFINASEKDGQKLFSHGHWASVAYKLSSLINLDFGLYPTWTTTRGSGTTFNDLPAYPGFTVNIAESLAVSPYVEIPLLKAEAKNSSIGGSLSYTFL